MREGPVKRRHLPKRRERRSGESPYQRHGKAPFNYGPMYSRLLANEPGSLLASHLRGRREVLKKIEAA